MNRAFTYAAGFLIGFFFDQINSAVGTSYAAAVMLAGLLLVLAWDMAE